MSEQKHTPGPWRWRWDGQDWSLVTAHSGQLTVLTINDDPAAEGRADVAEWESRPSSFASLVRMCVRVGPPSLVVPLYPDHPDARLIAAAPDMLTALLAVIAELNEAAEGARGNRVRDLRPRIEAAIRKAKGE